MIYKMTLTDSADSMTMDLLEVPIADTDVEGAVDNTTIDGNVFTDYLWLKKKYVQKWSIMCPDEYDRLRGFYTRQWTNATVPTYRLFYGVNLSGVDVDSGDYFVINNDAKLGATMSLDSIHGNTTQQTYAGKNLFATSDAIWTGQSAGRVTYSTTNDDFTFSRPAGADFLIANGSLAFKPSTTYSILFDVSQNTMTDSFRLVTGSTCIQSSTLSITAGTTGKFYGKLVTRDSLTQTYDIWFYCNSAGNTLKAKIMLVEGDYDSATFPTYEPYVGGIPAPNPDYPQNINTVTGEQTIEVTPQQKNIANPQTFIDWATQTYNLCVEYQWGTDSNRPTYGGFQGRSHVVRWSADTLYSKRGVMVNPTYDEMLVIYDGIFEEGKQYTFSADIYPTSTQGASNLCFRYTDGTRYSITAGTQNQWSNVTFTSLATKNLKSIELTYYTGVTYLDLDTLQIEEGTSKTPYAQFTSQTQEVNLGKNLFDANRTLGVPSDTGFGNDKKRTFNYNEYVLGLTTNNYYSSNNATCSISDGAITVNSAQTGYGVGFAVKAKPNTHYIVSFEKTTTAQDDVRASYYKADGTYISYSSTNSETNLSFSTPDECAFFVLLFRPTANTETTYSKVQIEEGLLPTSYSDYFTPIELCKIGTHQDKIYFDSDTSKWMLHKEVGKVVFDGTETWTTQNDAFVRTFNDIAQGTYLADILMISDYFTGRTTCYRAEIGDGQCAKVVGTNQQIGFKYTAMNLDVDAWKTWLGSNKPTAYFALGTSTDTEITDANLLAQLNAVASLYNGINNISFIPSSETQGTIEVKTLKIYSQETTLIPPTAVRLTLTDDGVINTCGCRRNIQLTMRETIQ